MKTSELIGPALDWAVAKCEGWTNTRCGKECNCLQHRDPSGAAQVLPKFSTDWNRGGPIIEREKITLDYFPDGGHEHGGEWMATTLYESEFKGVCQCEEMGQTPLIAAMRCFVASHLGDEVDIPEELK